MVYSDIIPRCCIKLKYKNEYGLNRIYNVVSFSFLSYMIEISKFDYTIRT